MGVRQLPPVFPGWGRARVNLPYEAISHIKVHEQKYNTSIEMDTFFSLFSGIHFSRTLFLVRSAKGHGWAIPPINPPLFLKPLRTFPIKIDILYGSGVHNKPIFPNFRIRLSQYTWTTSHSREISPCANHVSRQHLFSIFSKNK